MYLGVLVLVLGSLQKGKHKYILRMTGLRSHRRWYSGPDALALVPSLNLYTRLPPTFSLTCRVSRRAALNLLVSCFLLAHAVSDLRVSFVHVWSRSLSF